MGVFLSTLDLDTPIGDLDTDAMQGGIRVLAEGTPNKNWTFRAFVSKPMTPHVVGTAAQVAGCIEEWAASGIDGVNVPFIDGSGELSDLLVMQYQNSGSAGRCSPTAHWERWSRSASID